MCPINNNIINKTLFKTYLNKISSLDHEIFYYSAYKFNQAERKKADKYENWMFYCTCSVCKVHKSVLNFKWFLSLLLVISILCPQLTPNHATCIQHANKVT